MASMSSTLVESLKGCLLIFSLFGVHTSLMVSINDSLISTGGNIEVAEPGFEDGPKDEFNSGVRCSGLSSLSSASLDNFNLAVFTDEVRNKLVEMGKAGLAEDLGIGDRPLVAISLYFMTS